MYENCQFCDKKIILHGQSLCHNTLYQQGITNAPYFFQKYKNKVVTFPTEEVKVTFRGSQNILDEKFYD